MSARSVPVPPIIKRKHPIHELSLKLLFKLAARVLVSVQAFEIFDGNSVLSLNRHLIMANGQLDVDSRLELYGVVIERTNPERH